MALSVDVINGHGPSNEMRRQLQPTNKTECISLKSGCVVQVAKHLKGDWFIVWR